MNSADLAAIIRNIREGKESPIFLASPDAAHSVLERLTDLPKPFGTTIAVEGSVGIIRLPSVQ